VDYWQATGSTFSLTTQATGTVVSNLFGGATYYLTVSAINGGGVAAPSGIIATTATLPSGSMTVGPSGGTVASGGVTLKVPAGVYSENVQISLQPPGSLSCGSASASVEALTPTNIGVDVILSPDMEPASTVVLTMSYQDADIGSLAASQFVIARCDTATDAWVPLPSTVDAVNQVVTAASSYLSLFEIMQASPPASVAQFKVGPNPLRPSRGQSQMNFVGPAGAEVRIYTLAGELVRELSLAANGSGSWDATNRAGQSVASGVYFVYVRGAGQNHTFKVIVER
jgi:hypothetical protein